MNGPQDWPLARFCDRRPRRWWFVLGFVLAAWGLAGAGDLPPEAPAAEPAARTATPVECPR